MSKRTYGVTVPIVGKAYIEVDAASEEDAIDAALEAVTIEHLEEWESHRVVVQGNVFYGMQNHAEATDLGDVEE